MNSQPQSGKRRPYTRPMRGWWLRNPYYVEYMIHEGTAVFVFAYAVVLLIGLVRLSHGEAAWNEWLAMLRTPASLLFHILALLGMAYHTFTWFKIMPKTLPPLTLRGKPVAPDTVTRTGFAAVVAATAVMLYLAWRVVS